MQLWVALPDDARGTNPGCDHYKPETVQLDGGHALVFIGELFDSTSPVRPFTPLVGAEIHMKPGATIAIEVDPKFEYGFLLFTGEFTVGDTTADRTELAYTGVGENTIELHNPGAEESRLILIGGEPLAEDLVMCGTLLVALPRKLRSSARSGRKNPTALARFTAMSAGTRKALPAYQHRRCRIPLSSYVKTLPQSPGRTCVTKNYPAFS